MPRLAARGGSIPGVLFHFKDWDEEGSSHSSPCVSADANGWCLSRLRNPSCASYLIECLVPAASQMPVLGRESTLSVR